MGDDVDAGPHCPSESGGGDERGYSEAKSTINQEETRRPLIRRANTTTDLMTVPAFGGDLAVTAGEMERARRYNLRRSKAAACGGGRIAYISAGRLGEAKNTTIDQRHRVSTDTMGKTNNRSYSGAYLSAKQSLDEEGRDDEVRRGDEVMSRISNQPDGQQGDSMYANQLDDDWYELYNMVHTALAGARHQIRMKAAYTDTRY